MPNRDDISTEGQILNILSQLFEYLSVIEKQCCHLSVATIIWYICERFVKVTNTSYFRFRNHNH